MGVVCMRSGVLRIVRWQVEHVVVAVLHLILRQELLDRLRYLSVSQRRGRDLRYVKNDNDLSRNNHRFRPGNFVQLFFDPSFHGCLVGEFN